MVVPPPLHCHSHTLLFWSLLHAGQNRFREHDKTLLFSSSCRFVFALVFKFRTLLKTVPQQSYSFCGLFHFHPIRKQMVITGENDLLTPVVPGN